MNSLILFPNNIISSYGKQKKINKQNIINMISNQMGDINPNINSNRIVRKKIGEQVAYKCFPFGI